MNDIGDLNDVTDVKDVQARVVQNTSRAAMYGMIALTLIFGGVLYYRVRR